MMPPDDAHRRGVLCFEQRNFSQALDFLREALAQSESAELWSDWAATQFALHSFDESEAGLRCALEVDVDHTDALLNLGVLLMQQNRAAEARPLLQRVLPAFPPEQASQVEALLERSADESSSGPPFSEWEAFLREFLRGDENERSYFETHLKRYLATLALLPEGSPAASILELGAAFHHVTPALRALKNYGTVRCNDIWPGALQQIRRITSQSGKSFDFVVDNFDVQSSPWPHGDASFDAILCCEMLEHLHTDPMGLIAEINRILKPGGHLLLTTPNAACAHAIEFAMKGESPYVYGKFERGGAPTDRHNREYTSGEVRRLVEAGGFSIVSLQTKDSWWPRDRKILRLLAAQGHPIAQRGDNTFLLARREAPVAVRYPEEFYQHYGTQSDRRILQGESQSESEVLVDPGLQKILVIHELLPHFDWSGSDLRLMDVLRELRAQGHSLTFLARDGANADKYRKPLEDLGIAVYHHDPDHLRHLGHDNPTNWSLQEILEREKFDLAVLCHWFWSGISIPEHYLEEIRRFSPATCVAILTDDRHGERERRSASASKLFSDLERGNDFEAREVEVYRHADLVLYITEADHQHFLKLIPELTAEYLPIAAILPETVPQLDRRKGVVFLGNFDNPANRDALEWLLKEIWPRVHKKRPELKLYIAGHAAPTDVADGKAGIKLLGHVPSLAEAFAERLVFAGPIRFGTGINTKNMQALAHGLPVVTTSVGAEGMRLQHEVHALIADDAAAFADSLVRLAGDSALWEKLAASGRALIREKFSLDALRPQIRKIVSRAAALVAKPVSKKSFSYREVERDFPAVLTARPARYRLVLRTLGYWQRGLAHLQANEPAPALEQFRHIFTALRGAIPATCFHRRLLADMHSAYSALGDAVSAERCKLELGKLVSLEPANVRSALSTLVPAKGKIANPRISVVLPTFNRRNVLHLCLAALAFQTLPEPLWEVIVVDDGSSDDTAGFCKSAQFPYALHYVQQENAGAGAARAAGVEAARSEYVLLCNDDTIASSTLLSEHLCVHLKNPRERWAVLGQFQASEACAERALSLWVNTSSFFFPQQSLKTGQLCGASYFVTCNLSLRREAILALGNFDPVFRVAEDTELGARMEQAGYRVFYHPTAHATHEHPQFTTGDLLRRAGQYGAADWLLFQKHPQLLSSGESPFGKLTTHDFERIETTVAENAAGVAGATAALEALDRVNLLPFFEHAKGQESPAAEVLQRLSQIVPLVYWHELFKSFLAARDAAARRSAESNLTAAGNRS